MHPSLSGNLTFSCPCRLIRETNEQMIKGYKNVETRAIAEGARVSKQMLRVLPRQLHEKARVKLAVLDAAQSLEVLRVYLGLDLKTFQGFYQMRINDTYRIRFIWDGTDADLVEIGDFHS